MAEPVPVPLADTVQADKFRLAKYGEQWLTKRKWHASIWDSMGMQVWLVAGTGPIVIASTAERNGQRHGRTAGFALRQLAYSFVVSRPPR